MHIPRGLAARFAYDYLPTTAPQHLAPKAGGVAGGRRPHLRLLQNRRANQSVDATILVSHHVRPRREPENACHAARRAQSAQPHEVRHKKNNIRRANGQSRLSQMAQFPQRHGDRCQIGRLGADGI
jgi:hypothetical protein